MKVKGFGYFFGNTGYSEHTFNFFSALQSKVDLGLIPAILSNQNQKISKDFMALLDKGALMSREAMAIKISYGDDMHTFSGDPSIGYTVFEGSRLPKPWVSQLKDLDYCWVVSQFARKVLISEGIQPQKISIIPEGVDPDIFNTKVKPAVNHQTNKYRFLAMGKPQKRKGFFELIQAFIGAFNADDPVELVIHMPETTINKNNKVYVETMADLAKDRKNQIYFHYKSMSKKYLSRFMATSNAFVCSSRAEGWGLPIIESLALGLPVICYDHHGPSEFIKPEYGVLLKPEKMEPINDPVYYYGEDYGEWVSPSLGQLREALKEIYQKRDHFQSMREKISEEVTANWSWDKAAEKAVKVLKTY